MFVHVFMYVCVQHAHKLGSPGWELPGDGARTAQQRQEVLSAIELPPPTTHGGERSQEKENSKTTTTAQHRGTSVPGRQEFYHLIFPDGELSGLLLQEAKGALSLCFPPPLVPATAVSQAPP